jgi:hypothetical protein
MPTYAQILNCSKGGHFTPFAHLNHRIIRFLCHALEAGDSVVLQESVDNARMHFSLRSALRAYEVFGTSYAQFIEQGVASSTLDERLICDLYAVYRRRLEGEVADYLATVSAHA